LGGAIQRQVKRDPSGPPRPQDDVHSVGAKKRPWPPKPGLPRRRLIATPPNSEIATTHSKHTDIPFSNRDSKRPPCLTKAQEPALRRCSGQARCRPDREVGSDFRTPVESIGLPRPETQTPRYEGPESQQPGESSLAIHISLACPPALWRVTNHSSLVTAFSNRHIPELEFDLSRSIVSDLKFSNRHTFAVCASRTHLREACLDIGKAGIDPRRKRSTGVPTACAWSLAQTVCFAVDSKELARHPSAMFGTSRRYDGIAIRLALTTNHSPLATAFSNRNIPELEFDAKP
jgi:hypothetical protein